MISTKNAGKARVWVDENGFLWIKFEDNYLIEMKNVKVHARYIIKMCENKKRGFILDSRNAFGIIEPEAKDFIANFPALNDLCLAQAILVKELPNKLQAKAYLQFHKPDCQSDIFDQEEEAIAWLKAQVAKSDGAC